MSNYSSEYHDKIRKALEKRIEDLEARLDAIEKLLPEKSPMEIIKQKPNPYQIPKAKQDVKLILRDD